MGLNLSDLGPVYIVCGKTDLRKGIDSLAYLIQSQFDLDPFSKSVFLFCGGKSDRFKAIELSFFSSLDATQRNEILEKVFAYGTKLK